MSTILFEQQPEAAAPSKAAINKRLIGWSLLGLVGLAIVSVIAWRIAHALTAKPEAVAAAVPTVSVTEVAISAIPSTVSIIGTIAARYDMPIGVEGDGGRVTAVYVEAGDHVKQGQVLAHLNNAVLEPQVTNLEAALDQAKAEAELADAEYQRAKAVGSSGALSAEETQKRKSTAVTAAAHVKVAAAMLAEAAAATPEGSSGFVSVQNQYNILFRDPENYPPIKPPWGTLNAIDLNNGEIRWRIPFGEYPELAAKGMKNTGTDNYGGPVVTASGLLFIGSSETVASENLFAPVDAKHRIFVRRAVPRPIWKVPLLPLRAPDRLPKVLNGDVNMHALHRSLSSYRGQGPVSDAVHHRFKVITGLVREAEPLNDGSGSKPGMRLRRLLV